MELDGMKDAWLQNDRKLAETVRLHVLARRWNLGRTPTPLGRLKTGFIVELVVSSIAVGALAYFGYRHLRQPQFLIPAALLYLYALSYLVAVARQLARIAAVDYDKPIVSIQKRLEELRIERIRTTLWALLFGPLMWLPILIVGMRGVFGVDVYEFANTAWLAANVLVGLAVIPLAIFAARRWGRRFAAASVVRGLADAIAGQTLTQARASLDSIRRFEES